MHSPLELWTNKNLRTLNAIVYITTGNNNLHLDLQ